MSAAFITAYKSETLFKAEKDVAVNLDAINWVYPFSGNAEGAMIGVAGYKNSLFVRNSDAVLIQLAQAGKEVTGRLPQRVVLANVSVVEPGVRDEDIRYALFTFKDGSKLQTQVSAHGVLWNRPEPAPQSTARTLNIA